VPERILHIVRVNRAMHMKLLYSLFVFLRIVLGDSTLPKIRQKLWGFLYGCIKIHERLFDSAGPEIQ
jgi:hypothetical protein